MSAKPDPTARFEPGTVLAGRYRVVTALGKGGMGEVYRADDLKLGGAVALKFLTESVKGDERMLEMLLSEVRIARTVSHPNVCRVHDIVAHVDEEAGELHFLTMEHIDGEDLASLLRRIGRLPTTKALQLSQELCAGLAAVHARGLLHRDIKPGNVMIDGRGHARLTDFGLAIVGSRRSSRAGTPAYMAPEQHTNRETTVSSDLYALGLVLYEVFTGSRAFEARSPLEYAYAHLEKVPEPPTNRVRGLDPAVEQVLLECLEKVPERRPPSAQSVAEALTRIDPEGGPPGSAESDPDPVLRALLTCDLMADVEQHPFATDDELRRRHDRLLEDLLSRHQGIEIEKGECLVLLFEQPLQALGMALDYHPALARLAHEAGCEVATRVGIHFGELRLQRGSEGEAGEDDELARALAKRLMSLAQSGQTLLSRSAFDLARRAAVGFGDAQLRWLDHGAWRLHGAADPVDVFEVGRKGQAPLVAPLETGEVRRLVMQPRIEGWRPAPGLTVPRRPNWQVERRLGEGGFGEVWLVRHIKTGEGRGFKFCFDAERLQALQREITLFRLLKEELGERDDINRILDWNLDEAPYFIESEYTSAGDLAEWAEGEGGLAAIPLATRLDLVGQVATALGAAHSVGVLHKDIKPSNILIQSTSDGGVQAQLADFGIGQVTERERLAAAGITVLGLSEQTFERTSSSKAGTRLYMAPELLEGQSPTLQADLYALGILLYQLVVGDLRRALAPGWRRDLDDDLLAEDIACFVDRSPQRRPASAQEVAERLRTLDERRREHEAEVAERRAFETSQRRRKLYQAVAATSLVALVVVSAVALWALQAGREERRARQSAESILGFMVDQFEITDPFSTAQPGLSPGETITARQILDWGAGRVEVEFVDQPLVQAQLMDTFGDIYRSLGLYDTAEPLLARSLEVRRRLLGGEDPAVATSLHHRARLLDGRGDYEAAVAAHRESLDLRRRLLGEENPETLRSMHDLARSLRGGGDPEKAREIIERTLELRQGVLGPEHPETLEARVDLAVTLVALGDYPQARDILRVSLEIQERVLGSEHPSTLATTNRLASSLYSLGEYELARQLDERTLEIQERVLGHEHPATLVTLGNLANNHSALGNYAQTQQLYQRTLEIQERSLGPEHPATLQTMANLASNLGSSGDYSHAKRLQERILELHTRVQGPEHPRTLFAMGGLSASHLALGELRRAEQLAEQALGLMIRTLGHEHPLTLLGKSHMASVTAALGDPDRALEIWQEVLLSQREVLGGEHRDTTRTIYRLAVDFADRGELQQALALQEQALEIQRRTLSEKHLFTLASINNLGRIHRLLGDLERARELQSEALRHFEEGVGLQHPEALISMGESVEILRKSGDTEAAKELAERATEGLEAALGREHSATSRMAERLLEIAIDENDARSRLRWLGSLGWLAEREEDDIDSAELRRIRRRVLEIRAATP